MHSLVLIIPAALKEKADALGDFLGHGPNNYSIPLYNSEKELTHYGLHAWAQQEFLDLLESPEGIDFPDLEEILANLIRSVRSDYTNHFQDVIKEYELDTDSAET
jgi:hypothetical protein